MVGGKPFSSLSITLFTAAATSATSSWANISAHSLMALRISGPVVLL
jgi:hypothetical protein